MSHQPPPPTSGSSPPPPRAGAVREAPPEADPPFPPLPDGWWRGTQPHATFPVPFTVWDGLFVAAMSILGQVVLGLVLAPFALLVGVPIAEMGSGTIAFGAVVVVVNFALILLYLRARNVLNWRVAGPVRPGWMDLVWGLVAGIVGIVVIQFGAGLVLTLLGETDPPEQEIVQSLTDGGATTILVVLLAVVVAPIVEEVVFRGVWFQALRRVVGLWPGALISGLTFGLIHFELAGGQVWMVLLAGGLLVAALVPALPLPLRIGIGALGLAALAYAVALGGPAVVLLPGALGALGVLFALAFHRTGSLLVPIVAHAVFNGIVVAIAIAADRLDLA